MFFIYNAEMALSRPGYSQKKRIFAAEQKNISNL